MPIPNRTGPGDYHYHAYQYNNDNVAGPWVLSPAVVARNNYQFYSLREDLQGLLQTGQANHVPNITLQNVGLQINADGNVYNTMALNFGNTAPNAPKVVLTGGIHAREWIAAEVTYLLAEYLIMHYSQNPVGTYQTQLSNLINSRNIFIIPMLNPSGNYYTVFSPAANSRLWRKNRRTLPNVQATWINDLTHVPFQHVVAGANLTSVNYDVPRYASNPVQFRMVAIDFAAALTGVDCNRNCDTPGWGYETVNQNNQNMQQGQPTMESYFGTDRASEQEVRNLAGLLVAQGNIAASIDYHSYSELIIIPTEAPVSEQHLCLGEAMQLLIERGGSNPYGLGTPMQTVHYHAMSSVMDFMAVSRNSRSFTIELDPAGPNPGFQLPENQIMAVFEKNLRGTLALIATAGNNPRSFWGSLFCCCCSPWANSVSQFLQWNVVNRGNRLPV